MMFNIFSYFHVSNLFIFFGESSIQALYPFIVFLLLSYMGSSCSLDTRPYQLYDLQIFSLFLQVFFPLSTVSVYARF